MTWMPGFMVGSSFSGRRCCRQSSGRETSGVLNDTDMHPGRVRARRSQSAAVTVRAHGPQNMSDVNAKIAQLGARAAELTAAIPAAWGIDADGPPAPTPGQARTPRC